MDTNGVLLVQGNEPGSKRRVEAGRNPIKRGGTECIKIA